MLQFSYRVQARTSVAPGQASEPAKLELRRACLCCDRPYIRITRSLDRRNHSRQPADPILEIRNRIDRRLDASELLTPSQDSFLCRVRAPGLDHSHNVIKPI